MENSKINNFSAIVEHYKYLIGSLLLCIIIASSIFLLWRENYLMPEIKKRVSLAENRLFVLEQDRKEDLSALPVEVEKLISESKEVSSSSDDGGKVAGITNFTPESHKAVVKQIPGKININTASEGELDTLPGIGPAYAKKIVEYRQSHSGFKTIDQVKEVKGIGNLIFNKIKDLITI